VRKPLLDAFSAEPDADGDSQMHSSSDSDESSSLMFPSANDPPTPRDTARPSILDQLRGSELSPPGSQGNLPGGFQSGQREDMMGHTGMQGEGIGTEQMDPNGGGVSGDHVTDGKEPGWAWKNKTAVEEYHRAMEQVVDQTFSLRMTKHDAIPVLAKGADLKLGEFGDPFDEGGVNGNP
jgi:hypothetical protein